MAGRVHHAYCETPHPGLLSSLYGRGSGLVGLAWPVSLHLAWLPPPRGWTRASFFKSWYQLKGPAHEFETDRKSCTELDMDVTNVCGWFLSSQESVGSSDVSVRFFLWILPILKRLFLCTLFYYTIFMITIRFTADQRTKICVRKTSYYHYDEIIVLKNRMDPDPKLQ